MVSLPTWLSEGPVRRYTGPHGVLAVADARAHARRPAAGIGPLSPAVGFALVQLFIPTTIARAAQTQAEQGTVADFTIEGADGVPTSAVEAVAALSGVEAALGVVRVRLAASRPLLGSPEVFTYPAQGVTSGAIGKAMDLNVTEGSLDRLAPGRVALSRGPPTRWGPGWAAVPDCTFRTRSR